ncbi:MAG: 3,4-dihydroxy-2-butanone-4-phosphate synthase, partial [Sulfolobales archaeon]
INKTEIRKNLESGLPVLIYDFDGREEEVDMVFYAGTVSWKSIYILRTKAGGLICYVTGHQEAKILGLSFLTEQLKLLGYSELVKRTPYGDEPAFSIWVNHISTKTGISDYDRAKTIRELHNVITLIKVNQEEAKKKFYQEFYSPGHVPILISRGINKRKGHTELVSTLAELLGLERSMVIAEMLDVGKSLSKEDALKFARSEGLLFIEGKEILKEVGIIA